VLVLSIRTDKPEAEIGLFDGQRQVAYETWLAHRQLGQTIHTKIHELLQTAGYDWPAVAGIVAFQGPGSFTGLRIGLTVANSLADGLGCPIVGAMGPAWLEEGVTALLAGEREAVVLPEYGAEATITTPRK
jgi:tRNA threonylcarbamoyladenosine biosynthesis protein TsaB